MRKTRLTKRLPTLGALTLCLLMSRPSLSIESIKAPTPTCPQVLSLCGQAVEAQKAQVQIRDLRISDQQAQIGILEKQRDEAVASSQAWYRSPYLWATVGIFVGVYSAKHL